MLSTRWMRIAGLVFPFLGAASGVFAQGPPDARAPEVWAIVVGIGDYEDAHLTDAPGAVFDVRAVGQFLARTAQWDRDHVLTMDDFGNVLHGEPGDPASNIRPTRANLDWAVTQWLNHRVRPRDLVVIYFAGQSAVLPPLPNAPPASRPRDYLLPIDARLEDIDRTAWSLDQALEALPSKNELSIVCWLDTAIRGEGPGVLQGPVLAGHGQRLLDSITRWPRVSAWLAPRASIAREAPRRNEIGAFTAALLGGLGTPERPSNLLGTLDHLRRRLGGTGFQAKGGIDPGWSIWPRKIQLAGQPVRQLVVQGGHADRIRGIRLSPDGAWMASASMDSTLRFWNVPDGTLLGVRADHRRGIESLALSPDGRWLASGDGSGRVRLWDRIHQTSRGGSGPPPHSGVVDFVGFLPGSERFVSLDSREGKLLLWEAGGPVLRPRTLIEGGISLVACAPAPIAEGEPGRPALAAVDSEDRLHTFLADGTPLKVREGIGGAASVLEFSADGKALAIGGESGAVIVRKTATWEELGRRAFPGKIDALSLSTSGILAIGTGERVHLDALDRDRRESSQAVPGGVGRLTFSADGRFLAATSAKLGGTFLWRVVAPIGLAAVELTGATDPKAPAIELAFSPDGSLLIAGDNRGGIRSWSLADGKSRWALAPNRQKVARLDVSPDRQHLLQINGDGVAHLWNLERRGGVVSLSGSWTDGAFLPDNKTLVLTEDADQGGDVVLLRDGRPVELARPRAEGSNEPVATVFDRVAVDPGGRWVAASSAEGYPPLIGLWKVADGSLIQSFREASGLSSGPVAFLDDGRSVLSCVDQTATVWANREGDPRLRALRTLDLGRRVERRDDATLTAGKGVPGPLGSIALGTRSGRVYLWPKGGEAAVPLPGEPLEGPVRALAATADGRWLIAAGEDTSMRVWTLAGKPELLRLGPLPHHDDRIGALVAWPGQPMIVSGSDDTTVRLWSLGDRRLLGTFSASPLPPEGKVPARLDRDDWFAFTPDGLYDSSPNGTARVRWSYDGEIRTLEQYESRQYFYPGLVQELQNGRRPLPPEGPVDPPPALDIELSTPPGAAKRDAALTVLLRDPAADLEDLRLYQNGIPVHSRDDFVPTGDPKRLVTRVTLRAGKNRFHALASRRGSIDGRSREVEVVYDGPEPTGRLHVLSIGISKYERRALTYADRDATELADFLRQRGQQPGGKQGLRLVRTNEGVTEANIRKDLRSLRDTVKGHPEDTVVVFLAGHTGILDDLFCLLLPTYPFPTTDPEVVALRGSVEGASLRKTSALAYSTLYRDVARFEALQRLVVIDACQAEAIFQDPEVARIKSYMKFVAIGSRQAKTAYILAARRGEPAGEDSELEHGLLTYVLLRGLNAPSLGPVPEAQPIFQTPPNADLDGDGFVTSLELRRYAEGTLPRLALRYPALVQRGIPGPRTADDPRLGQALKLDSEDVSFPLVPLEPSTTDPARAGP